MDDIKKDDYMMPTENDKKDIGTITIRLKKKLLTDYTNLCKTKDTNRSKRIRNFMIFELKKAEDAVKAEEEAKKKAAEDAIQADLMRQLNEAKKEILQRSEETTNVEPFDPFKDAGLAANAGVLTQ
jgi:CHASE3 domain sensor protein